MKTLPIIQVKTLKENKDGSASVTFEANDQFVDLYKKEKKIKRVTEKGLGKFILELLEKAVQKKDGYDLKKS
jgi:FMN-dependent NADH-azoreductase